jgi:hypothetical protein
MKTGGTPGGLMVRVPDLWTRGLVAKGAPGARCPFRVVFEAIRPLMAPPGKEQRSIGFHVKEAKPIYRKRRERRRTMRKRGLSSVLRLARFDQ